MHLHRSNNKGNMDVSSRKHLCLFYLISHRQRINKTHSLSKIMTAHKKQDKLSKPKISQQIWEQLLQNTPIYQPICIDESTSKQNTLTHRLKIITKRQNTHDCDSSQNTSSWTLLNTAQREKLCNWASPKNYKRITQSTPQNSSFKLQSKVIIFHFDNIHLYSRSNLPRILSPSNTAKRSRLAPYIFSIIPFASRKNIFIIFNCNS